MTERDVYKWAAIDRVVNSALTFGGNILLANMLSPSDFGLLGMVAIFSAIATNLSNCGMSDGIIYKLNPTPDDYSTLCVFNGVMGLIFGLTFCLCSSLIADFFGHPELHGIMIAIGICFFFGMLSFVQEIRLRKILDFKRLAIVRILSTVTALILAIILVLNGFGYWGLVAMQVFVNFFQFLFFVIVSRWMPRLRFSISSFKELSGYGVHLMLAFMCTQIVRNINTSIIGKYMPDKDAGVYSQAQKMEEVPYGIIEAMLTAPFFSILSSSDDHNFRRVKAIEMNRTAIFLFITVSMLLLLVSWPAFHTLFGAKWDSAVPIFRILLMFGFCVALKSLYITVMKSEGKTKTIRNLTFVEVALQLLLLAFTYDKGIVVIAWVQVIPAVFVLSIYSFHYMRSMNVRLTEYLSDFFAAIWMPVVVMAISAAISIFVLPTMPAYATFAARLAIFVLVFVAIGTLTRNELYNHLCTIILKRQ